VGVEAFRELVSSRLAGRVVFVSLFGSVAEGRAGKLSDVDVAVLPKKVDAEGRLLLATEIAELASEAFGVPEDRVDVVFLDSEDLPIGLAYKAVVRGVTVYCAEKAACSELRLRVLSEFLDFQVFREKMDLERRYIEALKRRVGLGLEAR